MSITVLVYQPKAIKPIMWLLSACMRAWFTYLMCFHMRSDNDIVGASFLDGLALQ